MIKVLQHLDFINAFFTERELGISPEPFHSLNLGIKTTDSSDNVRQNWKQALASWPGKWRSLHLPAMCHGSDVKQASTTNLYLDHFGKSFEPRSDLADGLWSQEQGEILAVTAADCQPILICDDFYKSVAVVHAGWRGSAAGILGKFISKGIQNNLLTKNNLHVAFGPCIGQQHFEVGKEVAAFFPTHCLKNISDKLFLDLHLANRLQLENCGLGKIHIEEYAFCTYANPQRFFSHRREKGLTGRTAGVIGLV